jgi:hypothetical protein
LPSNTAPELVVTMSELQLAKPLGAAAQTGLCESPVAAECGSAEAGPAATSAPVTARTTAAAFLISSPELAGRFERFVPDPDMVIGTPAP